MVSFCLAYTRDDREQYNWDYVLSNFQVDQIYVYGPPGMDLLHNNVFKKAILIQTVDQLPTTFPLIALSPITGRHVKGSESLITFSHPREAIYLTGPDNLNLSSDQLGNRIPDHAVYIPTSTHDEMCSFVAAAVALYDRRVKLFG